MKCKVNDLPIYYEIHGEGHPIVMIHGFTPDHRLMAGCMEPVFAHQQGWQRIYFDLPGMGKTPGKEWITNSDQILDVVLQFINKTLPDRSFVLASESYGCYLARGIIQQRPEFVDGLLMICPLVIAEDEKRSLPAQEILVQDDTLLSNLDPSEVEEFKLFSTVLTPAIWNRFKLEVLSGIRIAVDEDFLGRIRTEGYSFSFDVDRLSKPFPKPGLFLFGRQDALVGYRDAWSIIENFPRSTFAVLDRAAHNLQIEQETVFTVLVNEWLGRVREALILKS
ncbi:MAG: alpha/beta fold hydrolase [Candidatus Hodarchaeota archaeon]